MFHNQERRPERIALTPFQLVGSQVQWLAFHSWCCAADIEAFVVANLRCAVFGRVDDPLDAQGRRRLSAVSA
jgi:hypothetical protein